jgi:hypothetical protein
VTAFIAAEISSELSIGGSVNLTGRSRRPQNAFDAEPQRRRVAGERELDGLTGQRLGLAVEQYRGGKRLLVTGAVSAARRVARPAFYELPAAHRLRR